MSERFAEVRDALRRDFEFDGPLEILPGGEGRTYRAGDVAYRKESDPVEAAYVATVYADLVADDFRVPRPIRTRQGEWLSGNGWSAWTFVEGTPAQAVDLPTVIPAVERFHSALKRLPRPAHLATRSTPFDRADQAAWGELPEEVDARLAPCLRVLVDLRQPIPPSPGQLIHGDLNDANILVHSELPPAILDFTPCWRSPEFALAVLAYWLGPSRGESGPLIHFQRIPNFEQWLVRAAIRTVLITHQFLELGQDSGDIAAEFDAAVLTIEHWMRGRGG